MADQRLTQALEAQLTEAHAINADLRERVVEAEKEMASARAMKAEAIVYMRQFEGFAAKQKAAEENAAAARRTQLGAEREAHSEPRTTSCARISSALVRKSDSSKR